MNDSWWAPREHLDGDRLPEKPTVILEGWNFQLHPPNARKREGLAKSESSVTSDLINHACVMQCLEALIKPLEHGG